jgi:transcriptional regulator GlxA family with amidase domain
MAGDGREATTHWATADAFRRRYPRANWQPEKLITEDGRILCSGLEASTVGARRHSG